MKVAFDHRIFTRQAYGGISRYFCNLATGMNDLGAHVRIFAPLHINHHLSAARRSIRVGRRIPSLPRTTRLMDTISTMVSKPLLRGFQPDIVHETFYATQPADNCHVPRVVTVHDMIHELFPELFADAAFVSSAKRHSVERADKIICVSRQTRDDLVRIFRVPESKVEVVYHGAPEIVERPSVATGAKEPFVLYIGNRNGYKNFPQVVTAFSRSSVLRDSVRLVCVGGSAFLPSELDLVRASGMREDRVQHVEVEDAQLVKLYQTAAAMVFPSFYEGFGLPILEAMAYGCPVACSAASAIPEVAGQAAEYFDPHSADEIAAKLELLATSPTRRAALRQRGYQQSSMFSWSRCARETMNVYGDLPQNRTVGGRIVKTS